MAWKSARRKSAIVNRRPRPAEFNYKHKKQTGGSGQYRSHRRPHRTAETDDAETDFEFEENVVGGRIPKQYIPSIETGFRDCLAKGPVAEFPVVGVKVTLE